MLIVLTTVSTIFEAESLAELIVSGHFAACVQILPPMRSVYIWEGKLQKQDEHLLLIKTLPEKFDELSKFITLNHPYDVPEIVAIDAERVSAPYLEWLTRAVTDIS